MYKIKIIKLNKEKHFTKFIEIFSSTGAYKAYQMFLINKKQLFVLNEYIGKYSHTFMHLL
jgi:hypothetical protein